MYVLFFRKKQVEIMKLLGNVDHDHIILTIMMKSANQYCFPNIEVFTYFFPSIENTRGP